MEHRCSKCGAVKSIAEFPRRSHGRPQCYCYPCWNAYHHERYLKNKDAFVARAKEGIRRMQRLVRAAKDVPCLDCGRRFPYYVMEHDHRDGEKKLFSISDLISKKRRVSLETLMEELAKCDVVCANCHRERTHLRAVARRRRRAEAAAKRLAGSHECIGLP